MSLEDGNSQEIPRLILRQPAQLGEKALHFLAHSVGGNGVGLADLIGSVAVELELNEKIEFSVAEQPFCNAPMQEVPQKRMAFHRFFGTQDSQPLGNVTGLACAQCTFAIGPLEHLALHGTSDREGEMRLAFLQRFRMKEFQK